MDIFANNLEDFELAVMIRYIYRGGFTRYIQKIYVNELRNLYKLPVYARTPASIIKNLIVKDVPVFENAVILTTDELEEKVSKMYTIKEVKNQYGRDINLILDKTGEYIDNFSVVKTIKSRNLGYKAIYFIYSMFKDIAQRIPKIKNNINKTSLYLAKKILIAIDYDKVDLIKLWYILQHIYKKEKKVIELSRCYFSGNKQIIFFKLYDNKLNYIKDIKIEFDGELLKVPVIERNKEDIIEFYIDLNKRRVYITDSFYISEEKSEENLELLKYL